MYFRRSTPAYRKRLCKFLRVSEDALQSKLQGEHAEHIHINALQFASLVVTAHIGRKWAVTQRRLLCFVLLVSLFQALQPLIQMVPQVTSLEAKHVILCVGSIFNRFTMFTCVYTVCECVRGRRVSDVCVHVTACACRFMMLYMAAGVADYHRRYAIFKRLTKLISHIPAPT